ncbi:hypothetical protein LTR17_010650 [Elasticomyces elasticus]|nr:hypothetical protein LTR17_010650 [Elasticomyces elasticus]
MSNTLLITAGPFKFLAEFEADAPQTVQAFRKLLPYEQKLIHVRWSGEGMWIPLGTTDLGLSFENHTAHPSAGQILLYPGGFSETEILFCYGGVAFASKMGALAANHFLTITAGMSNLRALGEKVLWEGAQPVRFESANEDSVLSYPLQRAGLPTGHRGSPRMYRGHEKYHTFAETRTYATNDV